MPVDSLPSQRLAQVDRQLSLVEDDRDDFDVDFCRFLFLATADYEELLVKRSRTEFGIVWSQFRELLAEIVDLYLTAEAGDRESMRKAIRQFPEVKLALFVLGEEIFWRVRRGGNPQVLTKLASLISLDDSGSGAGGCWNFLLADLYATAQLFGWDKAAIDHALTTVSVLSSDSPQTEAADQSTRAFLANYEP